MKLSVKKQKEAIAQGNLTVLEDINFEKQFVTENKDFFLDLAALEVTPSVENLRDIVERYISDGGLDQLNIDAKLRLKIEEAAQNTTEAELKQEAYNLSLSALAASKYEYNESLAQMVDKAQELSSAVQAIPSKSGRFSGMLGGQNATLLNLQEQVKKITDCQLPEATVESINLEDATYSEFDEGFNAVKESLQGITKSKYSEAKDAFSELEQAFDKFKNAKDALVEKTAQHAKVERDYDQYMAKNEFVENTMSEQAAQHAPVDPDLQQALDNPEVRKALDQLSQDLEHQPETTEQHTSRAATVVAERNPEPGKDGIGR